MLFLSIQTSPGWSWYPLLLPPLGAAAPTCPVGCAYWLLLSCFELAFCLALASFLAMATKRGFT